MHWAKNPTVRCRTGQGRDIFKRRLPGCVPCHIAKYTLSFSSFILTSAQTSHRCWWGRARGEFNLIMATTNHRWLIWAPSWVYVFLYTSYFYSPGLSMGPFYGTIWRRLAGRPYQTGKSKACMSRETCTQIIKGKWQSWYGENISAGKKRCWAANTQWQKRRRVFFCCLRKCPITHCSSLAFKKYSIWKSLLQIQFCDTDLTVSHFKYFGRKMREYFSRQPEA